MFTKIFTHPSTGLPGTARHLLAWALISLQVLPLPAWSGAALVADPAAPSRALINVSGNGVPIVQIVRPNAAGVSHNKFTHYNVDAAGQILNNSGTASASALAGGVGGNPMLGNSSARLILNEVTSANPSALNGAIEITGKRADLVIANPNGISVDGAGFINASRATLTTGKPQLGVDGSLTGLNIRQGVIRIQGKGLNADTADRLQLLSRSLILNASLYAKDAEAITGANQINLTTGAITPQSGTGPAPQIAIDVGNLGGMYANSIYLMGTEAGVGVNSKGKLQALVGDITLSSNGDLNVTAGQLKAAWDVRADAARDITLQAADIQAGGDIELVAQRNLTVGAQKTDSTTSNTLANATGSTTNTSATTQNLGSVIEAGGDVNLYANQAGNQAGTLVLRGSAVRAEGNATLVGADITLESVADSKLVRDVTVSNSKKCTWYGKCTTTTTTATQQNLDETLKGGDLSALGGITLHALGNRDTSGAYQAGTGNLLLLGASVKSDLESIQAKVANDLEVEANQTRHANLSDIQSSSRSSWLGLVPLSSGSTVALDASVSLMAQGSRVSADTINLQAGRDLMVRGSILAADSDITLTAGRDIDVMEARDLVSRQMIRESKKKGLFGSGLFGITLGTSSTSQSTQETLDTANTSQMASVNGALTLLAGRDVRVQGADLLAGTDIDLVGDNVSILAANNLYDRKDSYQTRTSGITLALKGGALDYLEAAWQATKKAKASDDSRLQAAYSAKAGYSLYKALAADGDIAKLSDRLGDLNKAFDNLLQNNPAAQPTKSGINLELSLGGSSSSSSVRQQQTTYRASNLLSAGDTTLIARATATAQGKGNIDIMGSKLTAHDLILSAGDTVTARYAPQTTVSTETSSNTAASVGVGMGSNGLYFTASGQVGNARGEALKEDNGEAQLKAENKLILLSGGNAELKGAQASARRIEGDIGGNLTLQSLQDRERYTYKSTNAGGSLTLGTAGGNGSINASQQKISNAYQSVIEQTGLYAGDGGFDIQVGKTTRLDGAAIASTTTAANANRISTQDIAYSDLTNLEQTQVSGYSFGLGTGAGSNYLTPVAGTSTNRNSVTQAIITPGTVDVRALVGKNRQQIEADSAAQQLKLAQLQTEVASLKQQKIQVDSAQLYRDNLPKWQALLAHAKAHPSAPWMYGIPMGALIEPLTRSIALAQTDPAKLQALIEQDTLLIGTTQTSLSSLLGLVSDFKALDTLTSRTLAGANPALANSFNANRTRNQIEAMNVFSETAMRVVGDMYQHLYDAVTAAQFAVKNAQASANPTELKTAEAGLKAAQAALDAKEGERALAHGLVGGLTAALGNVDPASGFLGGAAGKLATLELGKLIDGTDWARANPQAANALKTLTATATGSIVGGASGGMIASQGDRFNRQLHPSEIPYIRTKAAAYARANNISVDEAERLLARGALYANDADWTAAYTLYSPAEVGAYQKAAAWLQGQARLDNFTFTNEQGRQQFAFTASKSQYYDETVFLRSTLTESGNRDFYASRAAIALREMGLGNGIRFTAKGVTGFVQAVPNGMEDALRGYAALLDPATYAKLASAAQILATDPKGTLDKLMSTAKGASQDAVLGIYLDWLQKDNKELAGRAGYVTGQALVDAAALGLGLGTVKVGGKALDKLGTLAQGFTARMADDIAFNTLLKNGGVFRADGTPILDLAQLSKAQKEQVGVLFGKDNGVLNLAPDAVQLGRSAVGKTGLDDLYKVNKPGVDYVVVEYKFDSTGKSGNSLLGSSNDGRQMSNDWLLGSTTRTDRILEATGGNAIEAAKVKSSLEAGRVQKWLVVTDQFGGVTVGLLDKNGRVVPQPLSMITGGRK